MKIALLGYGKMGRAIEEICLERGHQIVCIIKTPEDSLDDLKKADVAIEFTMPESAVNNINACFHFFILIISVLFRVIFFRYKTNIFTVFNYCKC